VALLVLGIALVLFALSIRLARGRDLPAYVQALLKGKTHYFCAGIALGVGFSSEAEGIGVLQHAQVTLMSLLIWWLGLELGLQIEVRMLKGIPARLLIFDAAQSSAAFLLTLILTIFFLPKLSRHLLEGADPFVLASILSVAASSTVAWTGGPLAQRPSSPETVPPQILGNAVSILLFGGISTLLIEHPPLFIGSQVFFLRTDALLLSVLIGISTGILLDMAFRLEPSVERASCLIFALTAVAGGLCVAYDLPALFTGLIAGAWLINATLRRTDLQALSRNVTPVVEGLFLTVAGSMIGIRSSDSPLSIRGLAYLALLLFVSRAVAKTLGGGLLWRLLRLPPGDRAFVGTWLLPQGSLAVAVCVQPLFVAGEGPMQAVTILGGTAIAVALSQAVASALPQRRANDEQRQR